MVMQEGKCLVGDNAGTALAMTFEARNREIRVVSTILIHRLTVVKSDKLGIIFVAAHGTAITKVIAIIMSEKGARQIFHLCRLS